MVSSSCTDDGNECQNGGVCILVTDQNDGNKTPANYCQCPKGTSGDICHGVDVCPLNCQHGSSCRHYDDITHGTGGDDNDEIGFFCECPVGKNYKGKLCNIPFTTCPKTSSDDNDNSKSLQCLYGGECKLDDGDGGESYHCSCTKGRSGNVCQTGTSSDIQDYNGSCLADSDCGKNGLCIHKHDAKTTEATGMTTKNTYCQCSSGYGGDNCELNCDSLRCQHGSSCRFHKADDVTHANDKSDGGSYCDCGNTGIDGKNDGKYKGLECEIEVQVCPSADGGSGTNKEQTMECLYGGSCVGSQDDTDGNFYNCDCPINRMGTHCEILDPKMANNNNKEVYGGGKTNNNNSIIQNNNDVLLSQEQKIPTNVIVYGLFVIFFSIVIIVLGLMMYTKSKRQKQNLESQRAVSESLDDTFNGNDDKEEEEKEKNNEDLDGGIVDDGFYDSNSGGDSGDNNDDDIVNVNLDDDEPPHPKAEIV